MNPIKKVMDRLSDLTSVAYTREQWGTVCDAQTAVDEEGDRLDFAAYMARLKLMAAQLPLADDDERSIYDELVAELGSPL